MDQRHLARKGTRYTLEFFLFFLYASFVLVTDFFVTRDRRYFLRWSFIGVMILIAVCPMLLRRVGRIALLDVRQKDDPRVFLFFWALTLTLFMVIYFTFFPGRFTPDSNSQYAQVMNNTYNDWHPVIQTLLTFKLPLFITKGWPGSIVLFQIEELSVIIAYALYTVYLFVGLKYALIAMAFMLLNPNVLFICIFPWKDVTFAMGALLLATYGLRIYISRGKWLNRRRNTALFIFICALTTLVRHNAVLFTIPLLFAVFFQTTRKRGLALGLCVIALVGIIKGPVYSLMDVKKPGSRQIETLGLPMVVIGALATYDPGSLDAETKEFVDSVAASEVWREKYTYGNYNNVKWDIRTNNQVIEEYGTDKVVHMMLRCFIRSPEHAMNAMVHLTNPLYSLQGDYSIEQYGGESPWHGFTFTGIEVFQTLFWKYQNVAVFYCPHLFMYYGVAHLLLLAGIMAKYRLKRFTDWKRILFVLPLFVYNFGTALLLTSCRDALRFFFYTFLLTPVLLIFLFRKECEES